jgi:methylglutaconyl-CoA hydratase
MPTIKTERIDAVSWVTMSRPEKHNAFDPDLIEDLKEAFRKEGADPNVRVIVLGGEGASFSAGADLQWMRSQGEASPQENVQSAQQMGELFSTIDRCPKPVVARVQGAALGGGCGLVCCVDIAVAGPGAIFGFTEVRLGLLAAVISPFVLRRLGYSNTRAKLLTGERFGAQEAYRIGMVHSFAEDLDAAVQAVVAQLLQGSPQAQQASKELLAEVWDLPYQEQLQPTAQAIAAARASEDGREGLSAFLEKRKPGWALPTRP